MFYLSYIKCADKINNAFAEFGSLCHSVLERYAKEDLELFDLSNIYKSEFANEVVHNFPPNKYVDLHDKYYNAGLEYFENFDGFEDKVLESEQQYNFKVGKYDFTGFVDLVLEDGEGLIVCDHKSKSKFKNKREQAEYLRQLYLYSIPIKEKYGRYPSKLRFNMFTQGNEITVPFDMDALSDAIDWATTTIERIYKDNDFNINCSQFFCDNLCGVRMHCTASYKYLDG